MSDLTLTAQSPLGGYQADFDDVSLTELTDLAIVSIATPMGGKDELAKSATAAFGVTLPAVGSSSHSDSRQAGLLGLQRDQLFLLMEHHGDDAVAVVTNELGTAGYYTDQSDSWAILRITGPGSRAALERICMLDLSADVFPIDTVARTTMEHLSVMILRDNTDSFLLMSPRSSANSFLHAIETSIVYTT